MSGTSSPASIVSLMKDSSKQAVAASQLANALQDPDTAPAFVKGKFRARFSRTHMMPSDL
jgi:hypothetical protein